MYEDNTKTQKVIFLNEEADILKRYESDTWISPEEATAYATFTGASIDLSRVASARLITIANSAKPGEGNLIFNGQTWTGVWTGGDDSTFGIDDRSVTNSLISSGNGVQFKAGVTGDYFMPSNAILIVEYTGLLQTTQTTVTTITTTTTSAIGNSNSTANGNSNVTGTGNSTSTITFAPTKKINPQSAVTVSGEDSASGVKDNGNTDESDTGNGRQSSEITGNQDQAETRSSTSSSDILIPLPLAVVGAVVLVNSILAVIGLLLIVNDLKIGK
jgi:hypothetical protein